MLLLAYFNPIIYNSTIHSRTDVYFFFVHFRSKISSSYFFLKRNPTKNFVNKTDFQCHETDFSRSICLCFCIFIIVCRCPRRLWLRNDCHQTLCYQLLWVWRLCQKFWEGSNSNFPVGKRENCGWAGFMVVEVTPL